MTEFAMVFVAGVFVGVFSRKLLDLASEIKNFPPEAPRHEHPGGLSNPRNTLDTIQKGG